MSDPMSAIPPLEEAPDAGAAAGAELSDLDLEHVVGGLERIYFGVPEAGTDWFGGAATHGG